MFDILQYTFFQNALWAVLLIGIAGGIIGTYIVTRRMVFITGGITHASFGGLGIGLYLGISPTLGALLFAVGSALGVGWLSRRGTVREDSAIATLWALGMAVGIICIFKTPGYAPGLNEYTYRNVVRSRLVCTLYSIASSVVGIVLSLSYRCRVRSRLCFYPAVTGTAYRLYDGCNGVVVCGIDDTVGRHNASFVDLDDSANDRRAFYPTLQDNTLGVGTSYRCRRCVGIVAGLFARRTFRCMYCFFTYCCLCGRALRIKGLSSLCS